MVRVFISHAREDSTIADELHEWLTSAGHRTFLDHNLHVGIAVGENWQERLHDRLRWADAVVCVVTSSYLASVWCAAEVAIAQSRGSKILPVSAEPDVEHPLLRSLQYVATTTDVDACAARSRLIEALRRVDVAGTFGWPDDRPPFPGLRAFNTDEHQVFFGREYESAELASLLRSPAERAKGTLVLVVGPSGCGKSSLVRAGLIPLMAAHGGWCSVPAFTPGEDPVSALIRELAATARQVGLQWTVADVRGRLTDRGLTETADEILLAAAGPRRLLVVVDQFEELLTQSSAEQRRRFAALLRPALSTSVHAVGTLRPEFLDQLLVNAELGALPAHLYGLRPLQRGGLERAIQGPAELAGIALEPGLASRLIDDTIGGEALPLLAYTLSGLADGVERGGRLLASRYEQLGGVQGALARQADAALAVAMAAGARTRDEVISELLRLVTVDEQGRPSRWRAYLDELPDSAVDAIDPFVARRLLTTDAENNRAVIGVSHEAFLSAWPPLVEAIGSAATGLRVRRAVEQAATEWTNGGRPSTQLWERGQLAAALSALDIQSIRGSDTRRIMLGRMFPLSRRQLSNRNRSQEAASRNVKLSVQAQDFLHLSVRRDRRQRRRGTTILSILLMLAVSAAAIAVSQQRKAEDRQRLATARSLLTQAQSALAIDPPTAVRLGEAAFRTNPSAESRAGLVSLILRSGFTELLDVQAGTVYDVAFMPNAPIFTTATEDGSTILWDYADPTGPRQLGQLGGHVGAVYTVAFSPNGRILATAGADGNTILWDISHPTRPRQTATLPPGSPGAVWTTVFTNDGKILATVGGGTVTLWSVVDASRPQQVGTLDIGPTTLMAAVAIAPDGVTVATASDDGVNLWDITDLSHPQKYAENMMGATESASTLSFLPDGSKLAAGTLSGPVLIWDVTDPRRPQQSGDALTGHTEVVNDIAVTPDGDTLITASADGDVRFWDIADPGHARYSRKLVMGVSRTAISLALAPNGKVLITVGKGGAIVEWNLTDTARPHQIATTSLGHGGVFSVTFTRDSRTLAATADSRGALWDITDPRDGRQVSGSLGGDSAEIKDITISPDGHHIAVASSTGGVKVWSVTDPERPRHLEDIPTESSASAREVEFSPDGRLLAIINDDGIARIWHVAESSPPEQFKLPPGPTTVTSAAFAPDADILALAGDEGIWIYNIIDAAHPRQLGAPFKGNINRVTDVAVAAGGHVLATASADRTALLWDISDPAHPQQIGDPLTGHINTINALVFSPDGQTLVTGSGDSTAILWDLTDLTHPQQLGDPLRGHAAAIYDAVYSPDGRTLVTAGEDGAVFFWSLEGLQTVRADPLGWACAMTRRGLNSIEWDRYLAGTPFIDSCAGQ